MSKSSHYNNTPADRRVSLKKGEFQLKIYLPANFPDEVKFPYAKYLAQCLYLRASIEHKGKPGHYYRINAVKAKKVYADWFATAKRHLVEAGVVEVQNHIEGIRSTGLRLKAEFLSSGCRVEWMTHEKLWKALERRRKREREELEAESPAHSTIRQTLDRVTLTEIPFELEEGNPKHFALIKLKEGNRWGHADPKTGRFFHSLTNLRREFRKFVRVDGRELVQVDIRNCQPFLLGLALTADKPRIPQQILNTLPTNTIPYVSESSTMKFTQLAMAGELNHFLGEVTGEGTAYAKDKLFKVLFDFERTNSDSMRTALNEHFPSLYRYCLDFNRKANEGEWKQTKTGKWVPRSSALPLFLQNLESFLIFRAANSFVRLRPDLPLISIHDSLSTFEEGVPDLTACIESAFVEVFGVAGRPSVKIEPFSK